MSGHSKWATTKHKKAHLDAKRGKLFAKLIKNIEVAARTGGGDPDGNPTLYDAIQKARKNSVPADNVERARKRGAGEEAGGADWQTIMYEGYAPNGDAVLLAVLDAGAEEVNDLGDGFEIVSEASDLVAVRKSLQDAGYDYESAEANFLPSMTVPLDTDGARKVFRLIDALEDCDDVQNVYANFDVSDDVLAALDA